MILDICTIVKVWQKGNVNRDATNMANSNFISLMLIIDAVIAHWDRDEKESDLRIPAITGHHDDVLIHGNWKEDPTR